MILAPPVYIRIPLVFTKIPLWWILWIYIFWQHRTQPTRISSDICEEPAEMISESLFFKIILAPHTHSVQAQRCCCTIYHNYRSIHAHSHLSINQFSFLKVKNRPHLEVVDAKPNIIFQCNTIQHTTNYSLHLSDSPPLWHNKIPDHYRLPKVKIRFLEIVCIKTRTR